jgi:hypothetical protein
MQAGDGIGFRFLKEEGMRQHLSLSLAVALGAAALGAAALVVAVLSATVLDDKQASQAASAQPAASAATASTTGAYAYAFVNSAGTVGPSMAKNIVQANIFHYHAGTGVYCFDLPFVPRSAQATPFAANYTIDHIASVNLTQTGGLDNCEPGAEAVVMITDVGDGADRPGAFFVVFDT